MAENFRTSDNFNDYNLSDTLRKIGKMLYCSDVDSLLYTYNQGQLALSAMIDYKHGSAKLGGDAPSAVQAQKLLAETAGLPFFFCYYYLPPEYEVPMYFLRAGNEMALNKLETFEKQPLQHLGRWFSAYDYSRFQYFVRGMDFFPTTKLNKDSVLTIGSLSRKYQEYALPTFALDR